MGRLGGIGKARDGLWAVIGRGRKEARQAWELSRWIDRGGVRRARWVLQYMENIQGGFRSHAGGVPVDRNGEPLPWYTYAAIEYLEQLDFSRCRIFEFGSGNSSRFWARRAEAVISVESDPEWYAAGRAEAVPNQTLLLKRGLAEYAAAAEGGEYDVIVVDGLYRYNCAAAAAGTLKAGGLILLDNADWYPATAACLRGQGLSQVDFIGAGPVNSYAWCTSLFLNGALRIPRKNPNGEVGVRGGLVQVSEEDRDLRGEASGPEDAL